MTKSTKAKAIGEPKLEAAPTAKYVKVSNNMRCGWVMPRSLAVHIPLATGEAPLAKNVLYSKKSRVGAGQSVLIDKVAFDNFVMNKDSGVVNKALKNMIDNKCLVVSGVKARVDMRDYVDAPVKTEPTSDDMFGQDGTQKPILQTQPLTIEVTKKQM